MNGWFIAGYVFLFIIAVVGGMYMYNFYLYTKNRIFNKFKYPSLTLAFLIIVFLFLLVMGILFATYIKNKNVTPNIPTHLGLTFTLLGINAVYLVLYFVFIKINNKGKIDIKELNGFNPTEALAKAKEALGDRDQAIQYLLAKHKKYYLCMMQDYKICLERSKDPGLNRAQKLADIVIFNDKYAHRWSLKANYLQVVLSLEFLTLI